MREFNHAELSRLQMEINGGHEVDSKGRRGKRVMDGILNVRIEGVTQRTKVAARERSKDIAKLLESIGEQAKDIDAKLEEKVKEIKGRYYQNPEEKDKSKLVLIEGANEDDLKKEIKELEDETNKDIEELGKAKHKVERIDGLEVSTLEEIDCGVTSDFYEFLIQLQKPD
jgi:hypothetical protein